MAGPIMSSEMTAEARHSVHQASNSTGCKITSRMLTAPSGPTASPKMTTIQGLVRQRWRPPMRPATASSR